MADGRLRSQWRQLGELCSLVANVNRDNKKRRKPYVWTDWFPYSLEKLEKQREPEVSMSEIIAMFPGAKRGGAASVSAGDAEDATFAERKATDSNEEST